MKPLPPNASLVYRVVTAAVLIAWWARAPALIDLYTRQLAVVHVSESYFPTWLTEATTIPWLYITPSALGLLGLIRPLRAIALTHAIALIVCAFSLLIHQVSHAFQGANTAFWAGTFLLWLCISSRKGDGHFEQRALFIIQLILGMIFMGGAAGKWTSGYWDGEVMFNLIFRYQDGPKWVWLRETYDGETLRVLAVYYSRAVVIGESLLATLPLWPARIAFPMATIGVLSMWAGATFRVIDALGPVIGLAVAGWLLFARTHRSAPVAAPSAAGS